MILGPAINMVEGVMATFLKRLSTLGRNFCLGLTIVFFACPALNAQDFEWARLGGGPDEDIAREVAADVSNFVFVVGSFRDKAQFGNEMLTSKGDSDIFLARYRTDGKLDWVKAMGGPGPDDGIAVATDGAGTVCMTGTFVETADFSGVSLTSFGGRDIFLACYTRQGMLKWARQAGGATPFSLGTIADYGTDVAIAGDGSVYLTGEFQSVANFGGLQVSSHGYSDGFVAKYNPDGSVQWVRRLGGPHEDDGQGLAIDLNGDVLVTGLFTGTGEFGSHSLASSGSWDIYVSKLTPDGSFVWAQRAGGPSQDRGIDLATDPLNNVYVTGYFKSTADFGAEKLTATGERDAYVLKMTTDGTFVWAVAAHGQDRSYGSGIVYAAHDRIYATGTISGDATFGNLASSPIGHQGAFVARLNPAGSFEWVRTAGSMSDDQGQALVINGPRLLISGVVGPHPTFGTLTPAGYGLADAFVASIDLRPPAPLLVSPEQDANFVSTSPNLVWSPVEMAIRYDVQVASDQGFSNIVYTKNTPATNASFVAPVAAHGYYWRVHGVGFVGPGEWSEVHHFTVGNAGPLAPQPTTPSDNASGIPASPVLTWLAAEKANWHHVQVSSNDAFIMPELDVDHIIETSYQAVNLHYETRYFWRVAGVAEDGRTTFSAPWSFVTMIAPPGEVILLNPEPRSEGVEAYASFSWNTMPGVDRYHFQVALDASFSTLVLDDSALTTSDYTVTSPLEYATTYHWRVRAHNASGFGPWCPPSSFVVAIGTAIEQPGELPSEFYLGESYPNPFNPTTRIAFGLPKDEMVELAVFDGSGRRVALIVNARLNAGEHEYRWDALNASSGLYFWRLRIRGQSYVRSVVLEK